MELGDSKERSVLWRVFLCYLSSREERWHPRRALTFEKRFVSLKAVTGVVQTGLAVQREADCHVAALAVPRNDTWTNCVGTPLVRWKIGDATQAPLSRLWRQLPLQGSHGAHSPKPPLKGEVAQSAGGVIPSLPQGHHNRPMGAISFGAAKQMPLGYVSRISLCHRQNFTRPSGGFP